MTTKISSAMTNKAVTAQATATEEFILIRQYVSDPILAQTITGTVKGQVRCLESNALLNATLAILIKVVDSNGSARGTALALSASDLINADPSEFPTAALKNRKVEDVDESASLTLTDVDAEDGDRIIIELGYREVNTSTTRSGTLNFGDNSGTDLGENWTETSAYNPWIEFSATITFQKTLGYTQIGASQNNQPTGYISGCNFTTTEAGTLNQILAHIALTSNGNVKAAIYATSGNAPTTKLAESATVAVGTSFSWITFTISQTLSDATQYSYQLISNQEINYKYDAGAANQQPYDSGITYPTFPDPYGTPDGYNAFQQSIFGTYTTGVVVPTKTWTADAHLVKRYTKTATADTQLVKRYTTTMTTDAALVKRLVKTLTGDAVLKALGMPKTFTADATLVQRLTKTVTTDTHLVNRFGKTWTADAVLISVLTAVYFTVDSVLVKRLSKTWTTDQYLIKRLSSAFTADASLLYRKTVTWTADAVVGTILGGGDSARYYYMNSMEKKDMDQRDLLLGITDLLYALKGEDS